jgi:hydrocephalus-inducing protein
MDQPGIADAAAAVTIAAESAVPVLSSLPPDGALEFGQAFLGFPYTASFVLVNESRLPAKYEVLPQVR